MANMWTTIFPPFATGVGGEVRGGEEGGVEEEAGGGHHPAGGWAADTQVRPGHLWSNTV